MIKKIDITGIHSDVEPEVARYVKKKIAKLDGYMPRHARKSVHAEVKLKEETIKAKKQSTCEVMIYIPGEIITAKETTINIYAAIDIVEEKLKTQLRKYKEKNSDKMTSRGKRKVRAMFAKFSRDTETS
ncbi:MAG: ribosome-associated translation inhibitor RaiA [Patescibacteria group bacterium]|jgi:putative sigma-54 modulation protein|nr:ribosome-associated translation inhibitor RaiA [Patescibacteria group bacterium]